MTVTSRNRKWCMAPALFVFALCALPLAGCSLFSSSDDSESGIVGRMAWADTSTGASTIYAADIELSTSAENNINTAVLASLATNGTGARAMGTVVVKGKAVPISSVVFSPSLQTNVLAQGINFVVTKVYRVSQGKNDSAPAIDADNWDLIYFHRYGTAITVWRADLKTGTETEITTGSDPNVSTSNRLLYADNGIWSMDLGTGEKRLVLAGSNYGPVPLVKDGKHLILFNSASRLTGESFTGKSNFCLNEDSGVVTKLTGSSMKEDNPSPNSEGRLVVWHGWPEGSDAAVIYYGKLEGCRVQTPILITFHDDNGATLTGDCWYPSWAGSDMITFMNGDDKLYAADLQGNAKSMGLSGYERDITSK